MPAFTFTLPGSKSITNRALLIAALARGQSLISNALESDDTRYMRTALEKLGAEIVATTEGVLIINGAGGKFTAPVSPLFVGNAGTAMRFLTALTALVSGITEIDGDEQMRKRPIQDLLDGLNALGVFAEAKYNNECPPVVVHGGILPGGKIKLRGNVSSQYLSALLMTAPYAQEPVSIAIENELTSKSYIDLTLQTMSAFGVPARHEDYRRFFVPTGFYRGREFSVEADASSATYFLAAAAVTGQTIKIANWNPHSTQGDAQFPNLLLHLGCTVKKTATTIEVTGPEKLNALGEVDLNLMPDAVPTLAVLAAFCEGETIIRNVANLRVKETNRLYALANELKKIGADAEELEDGLRIIGQPQALHSAEIETYHDHRLAMSFAVAQLKIPELKILNPACVQKSFPNFWEKWQALESTRCEGRGAK